jgi:predicted DCC family thiol-disulfide oxidoreductase YuxK
MYCIYNPGTLLGGITLKPVVLFDGECNFCDSSVRFIIKKDTRKLFYFASLQSEAGQKLLEKYGVPIDIDSIVLIENEKAYVKSTAAIRICRHLGRGWKLLYIFSIIPGPIRNAVYDVIAKNRYKWFGKKDHCEIPPVGIQRDGSPASFLLKNKR